MGFCQTLYEPVDDQEVGFLQESRLHALVSRIDNCEIQRNQEKSYLTEKVTNTVKHPQIGIRKDNKIGFHYRFVEK